MWVSGWLKTSEKTGNKFMSLSVKPKEDKLVKQASSPKRLNVQFDDSDVPF